MTKQLQKQIKTACLAIFSALLPATVYAGILYDGAQTGGVTIDDSIIIDYDESSTGNRDLQFGGTSTFLRWTGTQFQFSNDVDLNSNQIKSVRIENVAAMPGGAGGLGSGGTGRVVELTATDSVAPGCTGPSCTPGTYSWNGTIWKPLQGSITTSNATKIVTVGPTGRDYTTIAAAAAYLNTLSGGEMWVDPGSYPVTATVDLRNIKVVGTDLALTTITMSGAGLFTVNNSDFVDLTIDVNAGLTSAYAMNVAFVSGTNSSVQFEHVDFKVNGTKVLLDSSAGTPPVTNLSFLNCTESAGTGTILAAIGPSNLDASSPIVVTDLSGLNALKIVDWPVTIIGGSNVVTTGTITSVPDRTILVSPGMNIQTAITSLGANGGVIKLLIGTHDITNSISIANNNIEIVGEGPGTIVRTQTGTWTGGTSIDDCVIQVGTSNGAAPRTNIIVRNFKVQVAPNIHGICINGGSENKVLDMTVESTGTKSSGRTGIVFTDGSVTAGSRFTASRSLVTTDLAANRWVDGVHFDGNADAPPGGLYGYGNGIRDSIISEMIVNEASETSYAFSQVSASGIFSNRARNIGFTAGALGLFLNDAEDVAVINNTLEGANVAATGISVFDNVDNSTIIGNMVRGGPTNYNIGINIATATSTGNIISLNQFENVNTNIQDLGSNTKLETLHVRKATFPTNLDDIGGGFDVGTLWLDTTTSKVYISLDSTSAAAVWKELIGVNGTPASTFVLDDDAVAPANAGIKFGNSNAEFLNWNNAATRFDLTDDLNITGGGITMDGNTVVMDNDNSGGDISLQFGQTLNETLTWDSANARFVISDDLDVTGAIAARASNFTAGNGNNDNIAIGSTTFVRITGPTAAFTIRGIAGGYDGRMLVLVNTTTQNMSFANDNAGSTAGNRILTNTGGTLTTAGTGSAILIYDATTARWRIIGFDA